MSEARSEAQKLFSTALVSLFTLDMTSLGGSVLNFTMTSDAGVPVSFGGVEYQPIDIQFTGLETTGVGAFSQPKITLSNSDVLTNALVNTYGDLIGCEVTRKRTYARFLDGHFDADPTAYFGPDRYKIERKSADTSTFFEWELSAAIDQEGKMIPNRVIVAGTCMWRYRKWTGSGFDYSKAQCPYAGSQSYDINNNPVANALDEPSRSVECCKTRFGKNQPLPFGGFPGASRSF
jgi:lambda family phage minor tail protein L